MQTFIYVLKLIPRLYEDNSWTENDNKIIDEHFNRIKEDIIANKIIHVGRTLDTKENGFGLVVFYAEDINEAHAYAHSDPAVLKGIMEVSCQAYKVVHT
ncbi:MAG: hypothetical protein CVV61_06685 [Tenericutes bacterium HGW-Tenericutes-6]|jgi:uncharacterized protein YciI|nr:MAG: hypothetical protein CVV61_06685 [Tenericutes bacterium HGW-Tenericutes-6]